MTERTGQVSEERRGGGSRLRPDARNADRRSRPATAAGPAGTPGRAG
ncbi:hypothetical protein V1634_00730 [Plantactinospora veratri]|uniref:Uncharacterized protein n=1 Tax=Plantactinospora veratri TaxID=1436122 RepID=A0ABU7S5X3_9ACTN